MLITHDDDAARSQRARCAALLQGAASRPVFNLPRAPAPPDARVLWSELTRIASDVRKIPCELEGRLLLLHFAPTALSLGVSLRPWLQVARGHTALGAACLDEMRRVLGSGVTARAQSRLYTGLLAAHGCSSAETLASLVNDSSLEDGDFALCATALGLGVSGAELLPEALGFAISQVLLGAPPELAALLSAHPEAVTAWALDSAAHGRACASMQRMLDAYAADAPCWERVYAGACAQFELAAAWRRTLRAPRALGAWPAFLQLLERKAPHAAAFHHHVPFDGQGPGSELNALFAAPNFDAHALARQLARGQWVVPGKSSESALLTRSTAFGGPMFGVFSDAELHVFARWIDVLPLEPEPPEDAEVETSDSGEDAGASRAVVTWRTIAQPAAETQYDVRGLYHALLNTPREVSTRAQSRAFLHGLFAQARNKLSEKELARRGLLTWCPPGSAGLTLERWVSQQIALQTQYAQKNPAWLDHVLGRVSHTDAVWLLTQLAPMAFVDGAWLAGTTHVELQHLPITPLLFGIYRDELGAGDVVRHHGNLMRRTLLAQGVQLPACDSVEFRDWRGFDPAAFNLACAWLAIAEHSRDCLPELLGINLATELAGIGDDYRNAAALLSRHGIDPYFFELHNSIDNAAAGHTAWSVQAIDDYLLSVSQHLGDEGVRSAWLRIWTGYDAYALASRPLRGAIARKLGPRVLWRALRTKRQSPVASRAARAGGN